MCCDVDDDDDDDDYDDDDDDDDDNDDDDDDDDGSSDDESDNVGDHDIEKEPAITLMVDGGVMHFNGWLSYTSCKKTLCGDVVDDDDVGSDDESDDGGNAGDAREKEAAITLMVYGEVMPVNGV